MVRTYLRDTAGNTLVNLNQQFLAAYILLRWSDLPLYEPYLWTHLADHLIDAQRTDDLLATVRDVGGAFMLTQLGSRRTTNDIDVVLKDVNDLTASSLSQRLKTGARTVATRNQIPVTWINDVIGDFLRDTSHVPQGTLWRTYGPLEVYVPEGAYILALKLLAGRPKDRSDIQDLCTQLHIQTRIQAQKIVDQYIPNKQVQQINDLDRTLDSLFP